jgi:hypothetical protein
VHVCPLAQLPQLLPQPSSPQTLPLQFGVHTGSHVEDAVQASPVPQLPQLLPQPSSPHCLPLQLGVQTLLPSSRT